MSFKQTNYESMFEFIRLGYYSLIKSICFVIKAMSKTKSCIIFQRDNGMIVNYYKIEIFGLSLRYFVNDLILLSQSRLSFLIRLGNSIESLLSYIS